jgi:hypothetical protein
MSSQPNQLELLLYPDEITVFRLPVNAKLPEGILSLKWFTISKTLDELSIIIPTVCGESIFRNGNTAELKEENGWRCFKINSVLDFGLVGILATIVNPLKDAKIPVFVVSTYDTDYVLTKDAFLESAKSAILQATNYTFKDCDSTLV